MPLVLRVSTSSFEFPFWTHTFFTGFPIIAEIIKRGHLYVPPSVYLWCFWALLPISSLQKSDMTAGWEVLWLLAPRVHADGFMYWPGTHFDVSCNKARVCSPLQPTKCLWLHMRCWPWADCQSLKDWQQGSCAVGLPEQLSQARTVQTGKP